MKVTAAAETPVISRQAYRSLGMVALTHSVTHMFYALMPIIYPQIMAQWGFGYTQLGVALGVSKGLMSLLQGGYGFILRWVKRRVLLGLGNILISLSMVLMPLSGGYVPFFLLNLLAGVGGSPQHPVGSSLLSENFGRRLRGTAFAINLAGGNAGTLLVPTLGTLALAYAGWGNTLRMFAIAPLITGILALLFVPDQEGFRTGEAKTGQGQKTSRARAFLAFFEPLKEHNVRCIIIAGVASAGGRGMGVVMTYVPLYLNQELRLGTTAYASLFTVLMVGSVAGPLLMGRLSDLFGRKLMVRVSYLLAMVTTVGLSLAGARLPFLFITIGVLGMTVYATNSLLQAYMADNARRETRDMAYSAYFTITYLAGAIWSSVLGVFIDRFGFQGSFTVMALSYMTAALALSFVRPREQIKKSS